MPLARTRLPTRSQEGHCLLSRFRSGRRSEATFCTIPGWDMQWQWAWYSLWPYPWQVIHGFKEFLKGGCDEWGFPNQKNSILELGVVFVRRTLFCFTALRYLRIFS